MCSGLSGFYRHLPARHFRQLNCSLVSLPASLLLLPRPRSMNARRSGPKIIAVLLVILMIAYQDNWLWDNGTLVFGFMPIGLFYHVCLSIAAALTWLLAAKIAWPVEIIEQTQAVVQEAQRDNDEAPGKGNLQ